MKLYYWNYINNKINKWNNFHSIYIKNNFYCATIFLYIYILYVYIILTITEEKIIVNFFMKFKLHFVKNKKKNIEYL